MKRVTVESSTIAGIGYDDQTQTLEVEFKSGNTYQYFDVPLHVFEAFIQTESKGSFLNSQIKGIYRYARL